MAETSGSGTTRAGQSSVSYDEALRFLYSLEPRGIRLELDRMRRALALRGEPHRGLRFVHVAGTNGKGSVAAMIESALRSAGFRTGLYTSPHLHRFTERIRVCGREARRAEVVRGVAGIRGMLEAPGAPALTFFEATTLLAFEIFRARCVDVAVLEVGLGGRFDATNVIEPELSVITRIALDHMDRLGGTLAEIAGEKAGILVRGGQAVSGVRDEAARAVIDRVATELDVRVLSIDQDFRWVPGRSRSELEAEVGAHRIGGLRIRLPGAHQRDNAAVAVAALVTLRARGFAVSDEHIRAGLGRVRWPGRLEHFPGPPRVLLDAAHNPDACAALAAHLASSPRRGPRALVFGAMVDKDHEAMLAPFDGQVDARIYVAPGMRRAAPPERLVSIRPGEIAADVPSGLARARELVGTRGLVIVAGSIFTIAEARAHILGLRADPPIGM